MNTELYRVIIDKIYSSGLSKRNFAKKYNIPHGWLIEFTNPTKPFRPMRFETIGMLKSHLGIDPKLCEEYNMTIMQDRKREKEIKKECDL